MIQLTKKHFIGQGLFRSCYHHPLRSDMCIKIGHPSVQESKLDKEHHYLEKLQKRISLRKEDYPFFSQYHGKIKTNLGTGALYDIVTDSNSKNISQTLYYYIVNKEHSIEDITLQNALKNLLDTMNFHKVIARDLTAVNICCKINKNNKLEMIIVDGIGHRYFIPLVDYCRFFTKKQNIKHFSQHNLFLFDKIRGNKRT